jgi:hypothetical protein
MRNGMYYCASRQDCLSRLPTTSRGLTRSTAYAQGPSSDYLASFTTAPLRPPRPCGHSKPTPTHLAGAAIQHEASPQLPSRAILDLGRTGLSRASLVAVKHRAYGVSRDSHDVLAIPARGMGSKPLAKGQDDGMHDARAAFGLPHGCAPSPSRNRTRQLAFSLSRAYRPRRLAASRRPRPARRS